MATEGPLIADGSQMTASASLASSQFYAVKVIAGRQVALCATTNDICYGILQNTPSAGQAADVGILGITKAYAGGTISAGAELGMDTSGRITAWSAGTKIGIALEAAVITQIFTMHLNPNL